MTATAAKPRVITLAHRREQNRAKYIAKQRPKDPDHDDLDLMPKEISAAERQAGGLNLKSSTRNRVKAQRKRRAEEAARRQAAATAAIDAATRGGATAKAPGSDSSEPDSSKPDSPASSSSASDSSEPDSPERSDAAKAKAQALIEGDRKRREDFAARQREQQREKTVAQDPKLMEERGYDAKYAADRRRLKKENVDGEDCEGEWVRAADPETRKTILGGDVDPKDAWGRKVVPDVEEAADLPPLPPAAQPADGQHLKLRWEAFCRLYAYGHSAADSARFAGYAWTNAHQTGWRLLQHDRVQARIRALEAHLRVTVARDFETIRVRAETVFREAMNRGQYQAALRALELTHKMMGTPKMRRDRSAE